MSVVLVFCLFSVYELKMKCCTYLYVVCVCVWLLLPLRGENTRIAHAFKGPLFLPGSQGGEGVCVCVLSWVARQVQVRRILGGPYARWDAVR